MLRQLFKNIVESEYHKRTGNAIMKNVLIFTGGEYPNPDECPYVSDNSFDFVLCADSGLDVFECYKKYFGEKKFYCPDIIIGDMDSVSDKSLIDKDDVIAKVLGKILPSATDFAVQGISPELRPGYLVGVRISRAVTQAEDNEPYTHGIGFINLSWSIVSLDDYSVVARTVDGQTSL